MSDDWTSIMNDNAFINRDELMKWLSISPYELRKIIDNQGLPLPIYGTGKSGKLMSASRWRVGDIREWLKTGKRVDGLACVSDRIRDNINFRKRIYISRGARIPNRLKRLIGRVESNPLGVGEALKSMV